jgi:hypothetical protein
MHHGQKAYLLFDHGTSTKNKNAFIAEGVFVCNNN